ncbi:HNH endonuclease [Plantibacter sp. VKM Ac-2885]|nr:HNH endonuclease [Plantibacter sp. VKM Ac-2885]
MNAPSFTRILVQPETGAVLSVGRNQYRIPADLQRAVRLRDGTCRAPGCGRRARACDLDHSVAWEDGGATDGGNLACLCRHHHRMKHLPGWNLDHGPGGVLEWTTPDGKPYRTEPDPAPF